jgi:hypothetical protein
VNRPIGNTTVGGRHSHYAHHQNPQHVSSLDGEDYDAEGPLSGIDDDDDIRSRRSGGVIALGAPADPNATIDSRASYRSQRARGISVASSNQLPFPYHLQHGFGGGSQPPKYQQRQVIPIPTPLEPNRTLKQSMFLFRSGTYFIKYGNRNSGKPQRRFLRVEDFAIRLNPAHVPAGSTVGEGPVDLPHLCWSAQAGDRVTQRLCLLYLVEVVHLADQPASSLPAAAAGGAPGATTAGGGGSGGAGFFNRLLRRGSASATPGEATTDGAGGDGKFGGFARGADGVTIIGPEGEAVDPSWCFSLVFADRTVNLAATSREDFDVWYNGMRQVLRRNQSLIPAAAASNMGKA